MICPADWSVLSSKKLEAAGKHVIGGLLRKVQVDQGLTISGALYSMFRVAYGGLYTWGYPKMEGL